MKVLSFLCSLILALSMVLGGFPDFEGQPVSAGSERPEITNNPKVNPELHLRVTVKQSLQGRAEPSDRLIEEIYPSFADPEELVSELVYIYMDEPPTESQLEEMESFGMTPYPETWVPPVGQHSQGFFLTDMPVDRLEQLAAKQYITRLDTAERQVFPQNDVAGSVNYMNTESAWDSGYDGTGVTVAVIDSSLDFNYSNPDDRHPDIPATAIVKDYSAYPSLDNDVRATVSGHGTHVTASVLGRGIGDEDYKGSAPGADLVFLKIGGDTASGASEAAIVAAIKAAVDVYHADIINISYGSWSVFHDGSEAKCQAVDYAVSQGATVFAAAGNEGSKNLHISGDLDATNFLVEGYLYVFEDFPLSFSLAWNDPEGTPLDMEIYIQHCESGEYIPDEYLIRAAGTSPRDTHVQLIGTYYNGNYISVTPGWYKFAIFNVSGRSQKIHLYSTSSTYPYYIENADPN